MQPVRIWRNSCAALLSDGSYPGGRLMSAAALGSIYSTSITIDLIQGSRA